MRAANRLRQASNEEERTAIFMQMQGKHPDGSDDPRAEVLIDMVGYIDYLILNHYSGNTDWPDHNFYVVQQP